MLIQTDPDATVTEVHSTVCPFHQRNPGKSYAGCGCSTAIRSRPASPAEQEERRRARLAGEREELTRRLREIGG